MVLGGVISALVSAGVFALYLPFLLIFAIFFALLQKTKILGDVPKINAIISFIASLYLVAFSPISETIGLWFAMVFATTGVVLVSILVFILVIALLVAPWWPETFEAKNVPRVLIGLGIIVGGLILIGAGFGGIGPGGPIEIPGLTSQDIVFLILIIVTVIILYWLVSGEKKAPRTGKWFLQPE